MAISKPFRKTQLVGAVVIGNGTTTKSQLVRSVAQAQRIRASWIARFGYTGPIVTVYGDGSVYAKTGDAGAAAAAKTYLAGLNKRQLTRSRVTADTRTLVQGALP